MKRLNEIIQLFDGNDYRSFNEVYAGQEDLFENVDDLIDPRMRKLFEATYQTGNIQQKHLREFEEYSMPGVKSWEDEYDKFKNTRASTKSSGLGGDFGTGPKGRCLQAISTIVKRADKAVANAYYSDTYSTGASANRIVKLFRDVKMGRKTANEAARESLKDLIDADFKNKDVFDESAGERELDGDSWTENIRDLKADYSPVMDAPFFRGLTNLIGNGVKLAYNTVMTIPQVAVAMPRDIVKSAKAIYSTGRKISADNIKSYVNDVVKVVEGLYTAAVKLDAGKDPLTEADVQYGAANGYSQLDNRNDGVPCGHNRGPNMKGSDPMAVQGQGRGDSGNAALFEAIFRESNGPTGGYYDSGKGSPKPGGDGVPGGHNSSLLGDEDPEATQGQGRGDSGNSFLFNK